MAWLVLVGSGGIAGSGWFWLVLVGSGWFWLVLVGSGAMADVTCHIIVYHGPWYSLCVWYEKQQ